jgi:uncharacterized protein
VVLLLKPGARPGDGQASIAIATGTGSEGFITDALAGRIRDAIGEAAVQAGRYDAGLLTGVQLLGSAYAREFNFQLSGAPAEQPVGGPHLPGFNIFPLIILFFILLFIFGRRARGGPGGCLSTMLWGMFWGNVGRGSRRGGGWGSGGGWGGGGWGGGGGGFGGFGGGGGFSGGGASGKF